MKLLLDMIFAKRLISLMIKVKIEKNQMEKRFVFVIGSDILCGSIE